MLGYLWIVLIPLLLSLALTPLVRSIAIRVGAVDRPDERKIHLEPVPRLGGVSVVLASFFTIAIMSILEHIGMKMIPLAPSVRDPMLIGVFVVFLMGVCDDLRPLPAWVKFLFQAIAAGIAMWFGARIEQVTLFGGSPLDLGFFVVPITFLWIVGITNAFNLVDGLDGLAAGLASIAAGTCAVIFLLRGDTLDAIFLLILLGALTGFLWYNFNPATIFLGDSGSLTIGYSLAITAITGSQKGATTLAVVVPLLVFGLPIVDTLLSMARRFISEKVPEHQKRPVLERIISAKGMFKADQGHIHHRLLAMGFTHRNAVLALYIFALSFSLLALLSVLAQYRNAGIILIAVGLATYIGIHKLGYKEVTFLQAGTLLRWYEQLAFNRLFFLAFADMVLITVSYWGAFFLKYESQWLSHDIRAWYVNAFPLVLVIQLSVLYGLGLYRGVWRAAGIGDLIRVIMAVAAAVALSYVIVQLRIPPLGAFSFFFINLFILGAVMVGTRSVYRMLDYANQRQNSSGGRTLIYGAGRGGRLTLLELLQNSRLGMQPIGFIDDEPSLQGRSVNRVPVLGKSRDLKSIIATSSVSSLVISSGKINSDRLRQVVDICREQRVAVLRCHLHFEPVDEIAADDGSAPDTYDLLDKEGLAKRVRSL